MHNSKVSRNRARDRHRQTDIDRKTEK